AGEPGPVAGLQPQPAGDRRAAGRPGDDRCGQTRSLVVGGVAAGAARRRVDPGVLRPVAGQPAGAGVVPRVCAGLPAGAEVHATGRPAGGGTAEPGVRAPARRGAAAVAAGTAGDATAAHRGAAADAAQGGVGLLPGEPGGTAELAAAVAVV